ncbi:hypothetical protein JAAARDRAFT_126496 [Jaapia argillacea MUCL 33604]|uniref:DNA repair protein REV1 n=1 Tax=Jaapia argillacea MUCL 33604 TaxID=933084 RepID=A0A067PY50_9AGAM|nr:hypothetical protein JAAARDRAFT_126496 [Jaapia argillacea MUCL 33604]
MGPPLVSSGASTDYFGDEDPSFLEALNKAVFPGDLDDSMVVDSEVCIEETTRATSKRPRSPDDWEEEDVQSEGGSHQLEEIPPNYTDDSTIYGASRFGEFGEYMRRKRAKLQIQNTEMDGEGQASDSSRKIFRGLAIYINGWTDPSVQDLRQLIIKHGGAYHAYLDKKALVTHIITCSLTPAKIREFKHMKVVKPSWLVDSAKAGQLLPWQEFKYKPGERLEDSQGKKAPQASLLNGFVSQRQRESQVAEAVESAPIGASGSKTQQPEESIPEPPHTPPRIPRSKPPLFPKAPTSPTSPSHIPPTTDPTSKSNPYASSKSNPNASRAMANPAWRQAHTSVAPDFIEGYYKHSRLHHLSIWKAELKELVAEAQERAEKGLMEGVDSEEGEGGGKKVGGGIDDYTMRGAELVLVSPKGKGKAKARDLDEDVEGERVIMHCDFDCFFVSAGLVDRPHLRGKPVVVCHSQGAQGGMSSTSEIASASYEAREFGIKGGMSLQQARKLCPGILTIPYEFEKYKQYSLLFYTILMTHADDLQAVSVDEALIDVSSSVARLKANRARIQQQSTSESELASVHPAKELAEVIRAQVRKATSCEVSIGISHNILLARLATRRAKPSGSYHLLPPSIPTFLAPLEINDLHGFGRSIRQKAEEKLGSVVLGELALKSKGVLCEVLGKGTGETLYNAIRGVDHKKLDSNKPRKSVSCEINYGIRFEGNKQAEEFVYRLAEEVAARLDKVEMLGKSLILKVMKRDATAPVEPAKFLGHGPCDTFNKQTPLIGPGGRATSDAKVIGEVAWRLLKSFDFDPVELRGVGIHVTKLEKSSGVEVTMQPGQAKLSFKVPIVDGGGGDRQEGPSISVQPIHGAGGDDEDDDVVEIIPQPPKAQEIPETLEIPTHLDLPSFSQVDKSVFDALPADLRQELEAEYARRSASPAPHLFKVPALPTHHHQQPQTAGPSRLSPPKPKLMVKGTTTTNVKRITQQLAPRSRPSISPTKTKLFVGKRENGLKISDAELLKLGVDPDVFGLLPVDLQREQLAIARQSKGGFGLGLTDNNSVNTAHQKIIIKPRNRRSTRSPSITHPRRPPPPQALYPPLPTIKQRGPNKGEKLVFCETDDVQRVIGEWVERCRESVVNERDVEYFGRYLVGCCESGGGRGVERGVEVMKWWMVLLRGYWGVWEGGGEGDVEMGEGGKGRDGEGRDGEGRVTSEIVGRAWWKAFWEVKGRMDEVVRKKIGGSLSLK